MSASIAGLPQGQRSRANAFEYFWRNKSTILKKYLHPDLNKKRNQSTYYLRPVSDRPSELPRITSAREDCLSRSTSGEFRSAGCARASQGTRRAAKPGTCFWVLLAKQKYHSQKYLHPALNQQHNQSTACYLRPATSRPSELLRSASSHPSSARTV